jgi:hypothetical protein
LTSSFSFSEEPLTAEKERARHPGMAYTKPDAALTSVVEILLIKQIDNIEPQDQFLPMPG